MLKKIMIVVVLIVAGILGYAATKPDTFRIERSTVIKAPADKVFEQIADFKAWSAWSPWDKKDPAMKRTQSGSASGKGAIYQWEGNNDVGAGRMEITEAVPPTQIIIKLDFAKPFEAHNTAEFTLQLQGESTRVTWAMFGPQLFVAKVMGLFLNIDSMVGKDFETGLANLKSLAEK
jgi:uncharacterized protein YndB with AHSA1/START domain